MSLLCKFPKVSCTKCLGDLFVEAILAQPSVLKGSLVECLCCANSPRHLAQNALESWLLKPSLPNLLWLRAPLLNVLVVQIPQGILHKMSQGGFNEQGGGFNEPRVTVTFHSSGVHGDSGAQ